MQYCQSAVTIAEQSQVGEARRLAARISSEAGLSATECGNISIIATEIATNVSRYAPGGELLIRSLGDFYGEGVEILAIDRGPGMPNVARCLEDGYSTGGTAGNGLGAVERLSTEFDVFSSLEGGTVVFSRVRKNSPLTNRFKDFDWGVVNRPAPYEDRSGDTWRIRQDEGQLAVMVADGLGHGPLAAEAADEAGNAFVERQYSASPEFFTIADRRLRGTRGAAIAVANLSTNTLSYTGVGNIAGTIRPRDTETGRGLVSHNGTVGAEMRKVQQFEYEYPPGALLIMHSDGLQHRWKFDAYPGLRNRHPAVIAGILYRDFTRGRDDVTVCVIRSGSGGGYGNG